MLHDGNKKPIDISNIAILETQGVCSINPEDPPPHDGIINREARRQACKLLGHPKFEVKSEGLHYCPRCGGPVIRTNDGRGA